MEDNFFKEIGLKLKTPWKYIAFKIYFFGMVILVGGIDIIYSVSEQCSSNWSAPQEVAKNMAAFALAIIASSLVDVNLSSKFSNKSSFSTSSIIVALFAFFLFQQSYIIKSFWSLLPASIGMLLGLTIWVLANHDNVRLRDETFYQEMRGEGHGTNW
jgi:hypothetical protein